MKLPEHLASSMQKYWDKQESLFKEIKKAGGINTYVNSFEKKGGLFTLENRSVCCIDERTTQGKIHYAGSGILDRDQAINRIKNIEADGVYSHEECGAAALAFKGLSEEEKEKFQTPEAYAKWWAEHVSKELGIPYKGHLETHPKFHIARVSYYDGTGRFDPSQSDKLPPGFLISRAYLDPEYAAKELDLSVAIAFGKDAFGKEKFIESPFLIIPVADKESSHLTLEMLKEEAQKIAKNYEGKVIVDGLSVDLASLLQKP